jgi:hypothetical protein
MTQRLRHNRDPVQCLQGGEDVGRIGALPPTGLEKPSLATPRKEGLNKSVSAPPASRRLRNSAARRHQTRRQ